MPTIRKKGGQIFYQIRGDGPPLVALRGLGRSISHWLGYDERLANHFKVITIDLRGIGRTTLKASLRDSIFDLAKDVQDVLDTEHVDLAHVLGVSLGGMITLACGLRYPERCQSLIVINTSIAGQRTARLTRDAVKALRTGFFGERERFHKALVDVLVSPSFPQDRRQAVVERFREIEEREGLFKATALKQLISAGKFLVLKKLAQMQVPTLVMYGGADRFVPPENSKRLFARLPRARLAPVEDGGHELTLDKPDQVEDLLLRWIAEFPSTKTSSDLPPHQ